MKIAVIDGQGGGIGKSIIEKLREVLGDSIDILALGTNVLATSKMMKAGANNGATGENAIKVNVNKVDLIIGAVGIIAADSMMGELTPVMANSIAQSSTKKILIPINKCSLVVAVEDISLPKCIDYAVSLVENRIKEGELAIEC